MDISRWRYSSEGDMMRKGSKEMMQCGRWGCFGVGNICYKGAEPIILNRSTQVGDTQGQMNVSYR